MKNNYNGIESSIYQLFEISPTPTALSFPDGKLEYVNPALNNLLGYDDEQIYESGITITHPDDLPVNREIRERLKKDPFTPIQVEKRYLHKLGHAIYGLLIMVAQPDENHVVKRYIAQIIDLSEVKKSDSAELLLNHLVSQSRDAIYVVDPKFGQILNCNHWAYKRLGYNKEELLQLTAFDINHNLKKGEAWQALINKIRQKNNVIMESELTRKDGSHFFIEANITYTRYNNKDYLFAVIRDISKRKKRELKKLRQSNLDPLTKLPNRNILESSISILFEQAKQKGTMIAVIYLDLDSFKQINDTHGHTIGDGVLIGTANRLKACTTVVSHPN